MRNKMRPLAQKALEAIQKRGGRIVNHDLLDATLLEINRAYQPGFLMWLKSQPDRWAILPSLEGGINQAALAKDEAGLTAALSAYRSFFKEMVTAYQEAKDLPLFGGR